MGNVFTPEYREQLKARIVELVRRDGRKTRKQLEDETGATRHLIEVLAKELVVSGAVYGSGHGIFPSEQARKDWIKACKKNVERYSEKEERPRPDLFIAGW
ncbi:phage exclusion protein [Escherichia coli]|nr:phage exclusion protein [Escherichia coli]